MPGLWFAMYCNVLLVYLFDVQKFLTQILLFTDGPDIVGDIQFQLLSADPPVFQLTCTSSTAPATTVQWSKDGSPVSGGSSSQIVTDTVEATYINELTVTGTQSGTYTCTVTTWRAYSDGTPETVIGSQVTAMIYVSGTFVQYTYAHVRTCTCVYVRM